MWPLVRIQPGAPFPFSFGHSRPEGLGSDDRPLQRGVPAGDANLAVTHLDAILSATQLGITLASLGPRTYAMVEPGSPVARTLGIEVVEERLADRGATRKALLRLDGRHLVEAVLMGYPDRVTVCISSQAGCGMGCGFCATGQMGLLGNLTAGQIAAQVLWARREAARLPASTPRRLGNVVFMGMGVSPSLWRGWGSSLWALSRKKINTSTVWIAILPKPGKLFALDAKGTITFSPTKGPSCRELLKFEGKSRFQSPNPTSQPPYCWNCFRPWVFVRWPRLSRGSS